METAVDPRTNHLNGLNYNLKYLTKLILCYLLDIEDIDDVTCNFHYVRPVLEDENLNDQDLVIYNTIKLLKGHENHGYNYDIFKHDLDSYDDILNYVKNLKKNFNDLVESDSLPKYTINKRVSDVSPTDIIALHLNLSAHFDHSDSEKVTTSATSTAKVNPKSKTRSKVAQYQKTTPRQQGSVYNDTNSADNTVGDTSSNKRKKDSSKNKHHSKKLRLIKSMFSNSSASHEDENLLGPLSNSTPSSPIQSSSKSTTTNNSTAITSSSKSKTKPKLGPSYTFSKDVHKPDTSAKAMEAAKQLVLPSTISVPINDISSANIVTMDNLSLVKVAVAEKYPWTIGVTTQYKEKYDEIQTKFYSRWAGSDAVAGEPITSQDEYVFPMYD
ncbi:unnamed protein product [Ambrosiozyma monospora]|uniref:Unnamed protein product n=1 Tax=Ambrosiozyma monospora TaxID=43982 RepID=A0ACB5TVL7_AMBMO|nr:unnamed protein product [Ambrosiozyma monospora]